MTAQANTIDDEVEVPWRKTIAKVQPAETRASTATVGMLVAPGLSQSLALFIELERECVDRRMNIRKGFGGMSEARVYNVESLAQHLRCSKRTIYNLIKAGEIRPFKIGKRGLRIAPEEVERWQRESTASATGSATSALGGAK